MNHSSKKRFKKCNYFCSNGPCLKKVAVNKNRCVYHLSVDAQKFFNTECPLCLEKIYTLQENYTKINCGHLYHTECIKGLNKFECAVCRTPILNLDKKISSIIDINMQKHKREMEQENANLARQVADSYEDNIFFGYSLLRGLSQLLNLTEEQNEETIQFVADIFQNNDSLSLPVIGIPITPQHMFSNTQ